MDSFPRIRVMGTFDFGLFQPLWSLRRLFTSRRHSVCVRYRGQLFLFLFFYQPDFNYGVQASTSLGALPLQECLAYGSNCLSRVTLHSWCQAGPLLYVLVVLIRWCLMLSTHLLLCSTVYIPHIDCVSRTRCLTDGRILVLRSA